jgi:hypothetical protein
MAVRDDCCCFLQWAGTAWYGIVCGEREKMYVMEHTCHAQKSFLLCVGGRGYIIWVRTGAY